ncbi:MAG: alpha-2-macroglobulin [Hyphomicrobiales bacterium]|nr:alpha-2-macroglobulin [Hyphomicrobiales bacterium]
MQTAFRCFASLAIIFIFAFAAKSQEKPFFNAEVERAALEYEDYLKTQWPTSGSDAKGWLAKANAALKAQDPRRATGHFASAVVLDKANADVWLAFARAYLSIQTSDANEKQSFPRSATSTAYLAYARAKTPALKASALSALGESLALRSMWRAAIDAYRTSLKLAPSTVIKAAFDTLVAEHGFRMLDYTVDSEAALPRLCLQFSEPLSKAESDFGKFVTVNGAPAPAVKAQNEQLCVEDLRHGERYELKVRSGLPSAIAEEPLAKPLDLTIYIRDRKPLVRFTGRNYVLPRTGQQGVPLVTVNTKSVNAEIYHIGDRRLANEVIDGDFANAIGGYKADQLRDQQGEKLWSGSMPVKTALNEEITTAFPIDELLPNLKPGLYVMVATAEGSSAEEWADKATQWFVVSDLGLTAMSAQDGVHALVRSLATGGPAEGVEVRLVARNNEVLATLKSDAQGYAKFDAGLARGVGGLAPALLVVRGADNDYGFLDLTKSAFDLTDRGVGGRQNPGALDAMLFTERGVYRPGETVYLTALLRDGAARAAELPLTIKIMRPDGVEYKSQMLADGGSGGRSLSLSVPTTSMTGTWRITAHADPKGASVGQVSFLVEDYTPERLEMTLKPKADAATLGQPVEIGVNARYLYGAPAASLELEGEIVVAKREGGDAKHPGYVFGVDGQDVTQTRQPLANLPVTNASGETVIQAALPPLPDTAQPLEARANIRLREPSGRIIEETVTLPVKARAVAIGVKPAFADNHLANGQPAQFDMIAANPDGKLIAVKSLKWEAFKVDSRFQWYNRDGRWDYEVVQYTRKIANGVIDTNETVPGRIETALDSGSYRLEVSAANQPGLFTSYNFTSGWYVSETSDKPDILDLALDKEKYASGDEMKVRIEPRMAGQAVVSVVSDKLLAMKTIPVTAEGGEATFTVDKEWGAGAYVTAILFRPMDETARRMPGRAIGVEYLALDTSARTIAVEVKTPERARPNEVLTLPVKLTGLGVGEKAHIVVSAVDLGILNLTSYKAPKPDAYYFGQRRLGIELRDLYSRLIDGMQGVRGSIRSGGDGGMSIQGRPLNSEPVALYSGIVEIPESGEVEVSFNVPAFDGTLRVMTAAWSADKIGHAVKDVIVRDPVVLAATPPRFLTLGDKSEMQVSVHNVEGAAGDYELAATVEGGIKLANAEPRKITLQADERVSLTLPISGDDIGSGTIAVTLSGPDGFKAERSFRLDVAPPAPNVTRRTVQTLAANTGSITIGQNLIANLIPSSVKVTVNAGRSATFDVPGLLLSLDRYPYGCAEQTVSRAIPLLYFNEVAQASGLAGEKGANDRIAKAIERVAALQDSSGSFSLWSAGNGDVWLTSYVTDFLSRAKEKGHTVPALVLETALDRLKNSVNSAEEFESGGEELAYALYVLARSGRTVIGDLRYYTDTKLDAFSTPLAKAQLGASLAMYGDKERAERAFAASLEALKPAPDANFLATRADFGTSLRDSAATLTLISESGTMASAVPGVVENVRRFRDLSRYTSTQENAWLLLAAKALIDDNQGLLLAVNGVAQKGQVQRILTAPQIAATPIKITNAGAQPIPASIIVSGSGAQPEPASANGFAIERQIFTPDGKAASLAKAMQNDRFVVVLKVTEAETMLGHIVIEDRLPAGFEIENPKLLKSADLKAFSWLKTELTPAHTQFRDDKFVAAFSFTDAAREKAAEMTLAYVVRALTPGDYLHPGATVEDMYRPERFARTAAARVEIAK